MSPLHARISADLAESIRSGAWPPGHRIPFEHEITESYGCARATASRAVQALVAAGLVERRRRAGTFVSRPRTQSAILEIPDIEAEVVGRGQAYGYELISRRRRRLDETNPAEAALGHGGAVLDLRCRHSADSEPLAMERRVIRLAAAPAAAEADFRTLSPGAWLLRHVPWSEAEHKIAAVGADLGSSAQLGVAEGWPCLRLDRWTWRAGEGVTYVRQLFRGDALELAARFFPTPFR